MQDMRIDPWRVSRAGTVDDFCETVFFTGNGRLGVRGFGAWERKNSPQAHAIFKSGLFSEIKPGITDMVQLPDALTLRPTGLEPETVEQVLDMRAGVLRQTWHNDRTDLYMERTVSMADGQLILQRLTLTPKTDGIYQVEAIADAKVCNLPVHDDQMIAATELVPLLRVEKLGENRMRLTTLRENIPVEIRWQLTDDRSAAREHHTEEQTDITVLTAALLAGQPWTLEKRVRVLADGESANPDTDDPWAESAAKWRALWDDCDLEVDSDDPELQGAIRYNIFQLLANRATPDRNASIGARGLSHGRYKGNTFWDTEIFMLPFYLWTKPDVAKSLLQYRADRLPEAQALAKRQNLDGARFPWMCAGTGDEQCESWDIGLCEVHITADVAYAMARYAEVTGDTDFTQGTAAEMYRQTALYWLTRLTYEPAKDQYSSFFVKGPDEYCGATVNNTFTNYMARRNIDLALQYSELTADQRERLTFARDRIAILYDSDRQLFLQDELLERLETPPFLKTGEEPAYKQYCFDRMQRYRVLKQADLVLLMSLFPNDFTETQKRNVFAHYEPITLHDSTLSYGPHAQLAFRLGLWDKATEYFRKAVYLDLKDVMGNTGHEGLHMAALGAAWQALVFGAAGLWAENGELTVTPMLPPGIRSIRFRVRWHGKRYGVEVTPQGHAIREET